MTVAHGTFERSGRVGDFTADDGAIFCSGLNRETLKDAFAVEQSSIPPKRISISEYRYRSQGVLDVTSFGGSFDGYMKSLPNIARNYAKSSMNHFEKEVAPANDCQLVVRLPPVLRGSSCKVDKLTTSHGKKIEVVNFHDVFDDANSDFLDIAWDDILSMSWKVSVRQSTSEELALKTCLLHVAAFHRDIRANDAVTVGLRQKSTGKWIGFLAYHFVAHPGTHQCGSLCGSVCAQTNTDDGYIAQGLAVLSHQDDSTQRKTNLWFLLFQQFLVNHIITVWGNNADMAGLMGIDMVLSPLNTRWLADQKVRLFVPVGQQNVRFVQIQEDEEQGELVKSMLRQVQSMRTKDASGNSVHNDAGIMGVPRDLTLTKVFRDDVEIPMDDEQGISTEMLQVGLNKDATWYFAYQTPNCQSCDTSIVSKSHIDPCVMECFKSHSVFFSRVDVAWNFLMSN